MIKKIIIFTSLCCLCFTLKVWAKPPHWPEFEEESANNAFIAKVYAYDKKGDDHKNRKDWKYKLAIYRKDNNMLLWACDYQHTGYGGGMVSDDGSTFVTTYYTYSPTDPIIFIYQNGGLKKKISGKELPINILKLFPTSDGFIWESMEPDASAFFHQDRNIFLFKIDTVDGQITVDLNTFEIKKYLSNKSLQRTFLLRKNAAELGCYRKNKRLRNYVLLYINRY